METLFPIIALIILGGIVRMILPFVLAILSFPGKFIAFSNTPDKRNKSRLIFGTIITIILQYYGYLAYTALVVSWTMLAMQKPGVRFIGWFAAIFAVFFPVGAIQKDARMNTDTLGRLCGRRLSEFAQNKANEREDMFTMAAQTASITFLLTMIGFVVFAFFPKMMEMIYGWVPFSAFH